MLNVYRNAVLSTYGSKQVVTTTSNIRTNDFRFRTILRHDSLKLRSAVFSLSALIKHFYTVVAVNINLPVGQDIIWDIASLATLCCEEHLFPLVLMEGS